MAVHPKQLLMGCGTLTSHHPALLLTHGHTPRRCFLAPFFGGAACARTVHGRVVGPLRKQGGQSIRRWSPGCECGSQKMPD